MKKQHQKFLLWLGLGNAFVGITFIVLTYLFVVPNCPGEFCDWRINRMTEGALLIFCGINLTAVSLYLRNRFLNK